MKGCCEKTCCCESRSVGLYKSVTPHKTHILERIRFQISKMTKVSGMVICEGQMSTGFYWTVSVLLSFIHSSSINKHCSRWWGWLQPIPAEFTQQYTQNHSHSQLRSKTSQRNTGITVPLGSNR